MLVPVGNELIIFQSVHGCQTEKFVEKLIAPIVCYACLVTRFVLLEKFKGSEGCKSRPVNQICHWQGGNDCYLKHCAGKDYFRLTVDKFCAWFVHFVKLCFILFVKICSVQLYLFKKYDARVDNYGNHYAKKVKYLHESKRQDPPAHEGILNVLIFFKTNVLVLLYVEFGIMFLSC